MGIHPVKKALGISNDTKMQGYLSIDLLRNLTTKKQPHEPGFELPEEVYSVAFREVVSGMMLVDPNYRWRYNSKENDRARPQDYKGPDIGLLGNEFLNKYSDESMKNNPELGKRITELF